MKKILTVMLLLLTFILKIFTEDFNFDPDKISNPRVSYGGWVTSVGGYLTSDEIDTINSLLTNIEAKTSVEIALVVVPNTNGDIFKAAQDIFDKWKIGKKDKNNGLLIIASIEERKFRTHTGTGMEGIFNNDNIKMLQDKIVIPKFKENKYGEGIIGYIKRIDSIVSDTKMADSFISEAKNYSESEGRGAVSKDDIIITIVFSLLGFLVILAGCFVLFKSFKKIIEKSKENYDQYTKIKSLEENGLGTANALMSMAIIIFGGIFFSVGIYGGEFIPDNISLFFLLIPLIAIFFAVFAAIYSSFLKRKIIWKWRHDPRTCPECSDFMTKLNEVNDDKYLKSFQIIEEKLNSIDYDVWVCAKCNNKTIEKFHGRKYGVYKECPSCKSVTSKYDRSLVINRPTYTSTGRREVFFKCLFCKYQYSVIETIPMLTRSSRSSGGSSSGGSSFGGGSSSGGGSTSSW